MIFVKNELAFIDDLVCFFIHNRLLVKISTNPLEQVDL